MTHIQVTLLAPGKRRGPWTLPDDWLITLLVKNVVQQMGLSTKIDWQLVPAKTGKPLASEKTLAKARVRSGATLKLEPVRNELFRGFLKALYEKAEEHVQDELWEKALAKLQELHEYDPRFPDPKGLRQLAEKGITPSAIPASGVSWAVVLGGLVLAGTLAVGAVAVVGGAGYLIWRAAQEETRVPAVVTREPSGGGTQPHTGDVQITLEWYSTADLDLHVVDPSGDEVYFLNPRVPSGGELDVDANYPCDNVTLSPIENVYWPWGGAPSGEYAVYVQYPPECSSAGTAEYRVTVRVDGEVEGTYSGAIAPDEEVFITRFSR